MELKRLKRDIQTFGVSGNWEANSRAREHAPLAGWGGGRETTVAASSVALGLAVGGASMAALSKRLVSADAG